MWSFHDNLTFTDSECIEMSSYGGKSFASEDQNNLIASC